MIAIKAMQPHHTRHNYNSLAKTFGHVSRSSYASFIGYLASECEPVAFVMAISGGSVPLYTAVHTNSASVATSTITLSAATDCRF